MSDPRLERLLQAALPWIEANNVPLEAARMQVQFFWDNLSEAERDFHLDLEMVTCVDPQPAAMAIAAVIPGETVIDAFCGAGGMAIALARRGKRVKAIELRPDRIAMIRANAEAMGVADRIELIQGNAVEVLPTLSADAIYADPLWGTDFITRSQTALSDFDPDMNDVLPLMFDITPHVLLKTPHNIVVDELKQLGRPFEPVECGFPSTALYFRFTG